MENNEVQIRIQDVFASFLKSIVWIAVITIFFAGALGAFGIYKARHTKVSGSYAANIATKEKEVAEKQDEIYNLEKENATIRDVDIPFTENRIAKEQALSESRKEYAERLFLPVPEIIEISGASHPVEKCFKDLDGNMYRRTFQIDNSFCEFKSTEWAEMLLHLYAPGYDTKEKRMAHENSFPRFAMLPCDEEVGKAIREFSSKRKIKGGIELVPLTGIFLFKAKKEYHGNMMFFYAGGIVENVGLCMTYPLSYVGTENEKKLMNILDTAAESYREEKLS